MLTVIRRYVCLNSVRRYVCVNSDKEACMY